MGFLISKLIDLKKRSALARAERAMGVPSNSPMSRSNGQGTLDPDQVDLEFHRALNLATVEAAQSDLAKRSKIGVALDSIFVGQLARIAQNEVDEVRALKNKTVFGGTLPASGGDGTSDDMNIIVCDDINQKPDPATNQPAPKDNSTSAMLPWLLVAGLTAGAAGLGAGYLMNRDKPASGTTVTTNTDPKLNPGGVSIEVSDHK